MICSLYLSSVVNFVVMGQEEKGRQRESERKASRFKKQAGKLAKVGDDDNNTDMSCKGDDVYTITLYTLSILIL